MPVRPVNKHDQSTCDLITFDISTARTEITNPGRADIENSSNRGVGGKIVRRR